VVNGGGVGEEASREGAVVRQAVTELVEVHQPLVEGRCLWFDRLTNRLSKARGFAWGTGTEPAGSEKKVTVTF
jgi:hypothetical protein